MENKQNRQNIDNKSIFKQVKLDSTYDNRTVRQSINTYRNSISNIMKNFTISDGEKTIKQAPRPLKHRPTCMNVLVDGMKKYIFGSNGLYKIKKINKSVDSKNTTAYNTHINDNKIKLINNSQYYKSINKTKIFSIDKKEDKHSDNLFLTDFRTTKHSDLSKSRNQFPRLQLDSNLITAYNSNTIFLKSFSSKKVTKQCSDIYRDNVELYRNFMQTSRNIVYSRNQKICDYNIDREVLGDIEKKHHKQEMIRNNSTGKTEFFDKRKVDLMKFGQNLDKIPDNLVLQYKKNIEDDYGIIVREANVDDIYI
jgi:hypothetical protein